MVLRQDISGSIWFILLWASLFSGVPLLVVIGTIYNAGTTKLACERIEPTQVSCELNRSHLFGLLPGRPISMRKVLSAEVDSETRTSEDGDYQVYRTRLFGRRGYVDVIDFSTDQALAKEWGTQINQFLRSSQPELHLSQSTSWSQFISIFFLMPFVLIGWWVVHNTLQTRTLILDKNLNRLTYQGWRLTGRHRQDYPLGIVSKLELKEHTDSYGNTYYEPVLLPDAVRKITFARTSSHQEALKLQEQIHDFLKLSIQPAEPSEPEIQPAPGLVFEGKHHYSSNRLSQVPASAPAKAQEFDRQLLALGFSFLGDLTASGLTPSLYSYAHTSQNIYAVIMASPAKMPLVALDLFSSFLIGTTLTTTTNRLVITHLKAQKMLRWSYPSLDAIQLYQKHRQHLIELQAKAGQTQRIKPDLVTLAALIDDCLIRQQSGWFPSTILMINSLAMAIPGSKS